MKNSEKVLRYLQSIAPKRVGNSEISTRTKIEPHQQVFQITQNLHASKHIRGAKYGRDWEFWFDGPRTILTDTAPTLLPSVTDKIPENDFTYSDFERFATQIMSEHFSTSLSERAIPGVRKKFDLVSEDHQIAGDAKYYTLVGGKRLPPAKFSVIAEHVWLLEKCTANQKFLVFGNDRRVPLMWLDRYGNLVSSVSFFFLSNEGSLDLLMGE